ncbi:MAG: hypothetical protein MZV64_33855 [Ignavibacteriales bacterium]|nr:hypothetical protein [Ignavibacteriales bacterium]
MGRRPDPHRADRGRRDRRRAGSLGAVRARVRRGGRWARRRHVLVRFSDPPDQRNQDLRGLVTIAGHEPLTFEIDNNVVRVYSAKGFDGIARGRRQSRRAQLQRSAAWRSGLTRTVAFQPSRPQVRFVGRGHHPARQGPADRPLRGREPAARSR